MYGTGGYFPEDGSASSVATSVTNTTYTQKTPHQIIDEEIASMEASKKYYQDELRALDSRIAFAKALKEKIPNYYTTLTGTTGTILPDSYFTPNDLQSVKITCDTNKEDKAL